MRIGLFFNTLLTADQTAADAYTEILEQAEIADDVGYDSLWVGETHFHAAEASPQPQTLLNAIASVTHGVRLGTASKAITLDNPIRVAEDFAVLDLASNGRVVLGAAAGDDAEAFKHYHVSYEDREDRFREYLDLIVKSWTCDGFSYAGKYHRIPSYAEPDSAGNVFAREPYTPPQSPQWLRAGTKVAYLPLTPKPVQLPHPPVWVGATSDALIDFAATAGYTYLPSFLEATATFRARVARYRRTLLAAGRATAEVEWPAVRVCYVAETSEQARQDMAGPLQALFAHHAATGRLAAAEGRVVAAADLSYEKLAAERAIIGSVDEVVDGVKRLYQEAGMNHFIACMSLPGLRHDKVIASMRLFNAEVWSRLQA